MTRDKETFEQQLWSEMKTARFWLHVAIGTALAIALVIGWLAL